MTNGVSIIRAKASLEDRRLRGKEIVRKRVAAYCRVSTDGEEQLSSFSSQVKYYTELIEKDPDWMMAGIYSDEAITGTQVSKREGFQKMIKACLDGEIDMVITKSISRFARNTLDTLRYVRTLKERNIAVYFEDEKINTLSMDGELLLVVLSSVAQQEVENISNNVKKGLAMKMSRGEIVGFTGALGYDYDPATKTMKVNQEQAKIVQFIFNRYVSGVGTSTIAKELINMGVPSPSGAKTWHQSTVAGIIKNEKYCGDLLQGKTFTVDPIAKRRLENLGESDKYLLKDHHEAIVSREVFEKAQEILLKRGKCHSNSRLKKDEYRTLYTNKYAFSCKCRCGFCGATLTRRTWHSGKYKKNIWLCITASKSGKKNCPNCKAITEEALMSAFIESYKLMTRGHKEVLDEFLQRVESNLSDNDVLKRIEKEKDKLKDMSCKLNNLLDMHLEGKIDFDTYEKKRESLQKDIEEKKAEISALEDIGRTKLDLESRVTFMRERLAKGDIIKEFDRQVFESIVDYVIVGGYNEEGNADPSMITFVYRTGYKDRKNGDNFKPARLNASKKNAGTGSSDIKACQGDDAPLKDSDSSKNYSILQSLASGDWDIMQSNTTDGACGD
ncbi:site-specific recombinase, DNA invertase Pin, partial [Lachnospiraceae bacterium JC7]